MWREAFAKINFQSTKPEILDEDILQVEVHEDLVNKMCSLTHEKFLQEQRVNIMARTVRATQINAVQKQALKKMKKQVAKDNSNLLTLQEQSVKAAELLQLRQTKLVHLQEEQKITQDTCVKLEGYNTKVSQRLQDLTKTNDKLQKNLEQAEQHNESLTEKLDHAKDFTMVLEVTKKNKKNKKKKEQEQEEEFLGRNRHRRANSAPLARLHFR